MNGRHRDARGLEVLKREVGIDARHVPAQRDEGIVDTIGHILAGVTDSATPVSSQSVVSVRMPDYAGRLTTATRCLRGSR